LPDSSPKRGERRGEEEMISKKILASIVVIGILALAIGWGTYSLFFDTETSKGNKFTAGTLDLKVWNETLSAWVDEPDVPHFEIAGVEPGDFGSYLFKLKNSGNLNGTAKIHIKDVYNDGGEYAEPEGSTNDGDLGGAVYVTVKYDGTVVVTGTLNDLNSKIYTLGALNAGQNKTVTILWWIPQEVGNSIMGDIVKFNIEFLLDKPLKVVAGSPANMIQGFGVRYRHFMDGTNDNEVYIGVDDLGNSANRKQGDVVWQTNNKIYFKYNKDEDKLITTVDAGADGSIDLTLEYTNLASNLQSLVGKPVSEVDFLVINVVARQSGTSVDFNNVVLNDIPLGNFHAEYNQWNTWTVLDFDFSQTFAISGDLIINGIASREANKVELMVGFYP
jgi:predicted ribosomally synthesized peptide with SipW-like signal peptide